MPLGEPVSVAKSDELWVLEEPSVPVDPNAFVVGVEDVVVGVKDVVVDVEDVAVDVVVDVVDSEH